MRQGGMEDNERVIVVERGSTGIGAFVLGAAIGVGLALLVAPQSGAATRRDLRRRARRIRDGVGDAVADGLDRARDMVEEGAVRVRDAIGENGLVGKAMEAGRAAADEARAEMQEHLGQTKAAYRAGARVARASRHPRSGTSTDSTD